MTGDLWPESEAYGFSASMMLRRLRLSLPASSKLASYTLLLLPSMASHRLLSGSTDT